MYHLDGEEVDFFRRRSKLIAKSKSAERKGQKKLIPILIGPGFLRDERLFRFCMRFMNNNKLNRIRKGLQQQQLTGKSYPLLLTERASGQIVTGKGSTTCTSFIGPGLYYLFIQGNPVSPPPILRTRPITTCRPEFWLI